jgi:hypothetical protein
VRLVVRSIATGTSGSSGRRTARAIAANHNEGSDAWPIRFSTEDLYLKLPSCPDPASKASDDGARSTFGEKITKTICAAVRMPRSRGRQLCCSITMTAQRACSGHAKKRDAQEWVPIPLSSGQTLGYHQHHLARQLFIEQHAKKDPIETGPVTVCLRVVAFINPTSI